MAYTRETWAEALLDGLGMPVSKLAVTDIMCWEATENTQAKFNPLATTQPMSGSTMFNDLGNGIGVQNYTSAEQGLNATIKTLNNGHYTEILNALSIGGTQDFGATVGASPWGTQEFSVTGQPIKNLTSPTGAGASTTLTDDTPPVLGKNYPGLFLNSDGVYQIKYSASIGADIANMAGQNSSISAIKTFNDGSTAAATKYGVTSKEYIEWVNASLPAIYGANSATSSTGGSAGAMNGLTLSTMTMKDLYIIIGIILVGVLILIIVAKNLRPIASGVEKVAPLAAM